MLWVLESSYSSLRFFISFFSLCPMDKVLRNLLNERVGDCSNGKDKNIPPLFFSYLTVLNTSTTQCHGFNCVLPVLFGHIYRVKKHWRNERLKRMHNEPPVQHKSRKFIHALNKIWRFSPPLS